MTGRSNMKLVVSLWCCLIGAAVVQGHSSSSNEAGRSLVIVFDTTWSMDDDLQELRAGAAHIVKEMMRKETNPIYNYVFVPFNDPCELSSGTFGPLSTLFGVISDLRFPLVFTYRKFIKLDKVVNNQ